MGKFRAIIMCGIGGAMDPAVAPNKLLEEVPEGDWVGFSPDRTQVLAHGLDLHEVLEAAPEDIGIITRKFTSCLMAQGE
jgi:hypothetical protein